MPSPTDSTTQPTLSDEFMNVNSSAPIKHTIIVLAVFQTIFIVLFYISRHIKKNTHGVDYWFLIPASYLLCMSHTATMSLFITIGGAGQHAAALMIKNPQAIVNWLKLDKALEFTHQFSNLFPKLAILYLYMRIFTSRPYRIFAYMTGTVIILTDVGANIASLVICRPIAFHWDKTIEGGKCGDILALYRYICVPNLITDFALLVLPLPAVYKLHVRTPVKVGLFVTFLTGGMGIVGSIIRTVQLFTIDLFADITYNSVDNIVWTLIEPGMYFMAACMPGLRPLGQHLFKKLNFDMNYITSRFRSNPSHQTGEASYDQNRVIFRKRTVDVKSSTLSRDDTASTESMRGLNLHNDGYLELDEFDNPTNGSNNRTKVNERDVC